MTRTVEDEHTYDVVVIGAGPVGENVVDRVRAGGLTAAIVESELIGGECSYWACMPSKALLRPAIARSDARKVAGLRESVYGPLDAMDVFAHRDEVVGHWKDDGQVDWLDSIGVRVFRGHGRLLGPRRVEVAGPEENATCSPPGTRSPSAPAPARSSPSCRDCPRRTPGPAVRRPVPTGCPSGSSSSAGEWWAWRWPPPTRPSARR